MCVCVCLSVCLSVCLCVCVCEMTDTQLLFFIQWATLYEMAPVLFMLLAIKINCAAFLLYTCKNDFHKQSLNNYSRLVIKYVWLTLLSRKMPNSFIGESGDLFGTFNINYSKNLRASGLSSPGFLKPTIKSNQNYHFVDKHNTKMQ